MNPVYQKFTSQVATDAARAAAVSGHSTAFDWLEGEWLWHGRRVRFQTTPYGIARDASSPYLIHNAASGMWILALSEPSAFGMLIGLPAADGTSRFSGDVTMDGASVRLRQSWLRRENVVEIRNERFDAGRWILWDFALLERATPAN